MDNTLDDMTSKDAFFALETTMEEDMEEYGREVTLLAIKHINSTPKLYELVKKTNNIQSVCDVWARKNNHEFGDLFIAELDIVNWDEVRRMV